MSEIKPEIKTRVMLKFSKIMDKFATHSSTLRAHVSPEEIALFDKFGNHNAIIKYQEEFYIIGRTLKGESTLMRLELDQVQYLKEFLDKNGPNLR